jgi:hypothetical protein
MQKLVKTKVNSPKKRRRAFEDPSGAMFPIVIDVFDNDGHANVSTESFKVPANNAYNWAAKILGQWRIAPTGANTDRFVLPVMWDNSELSYHVPMEPGYQAKLAMFT